MKLTPEQIDQVIVFDFIRTKPELKEIAIHIANERKCTPMLGRLLKRMGVLRGVSDIFIPKSGGDYKGLWIELKVGNNKATKEQANFLENMRREGYHAVEINGAKNAIDLITRFYGL